MPQSLFLAASYKQESAWACGVCAARGMWGEAEKQQLTCILQKCHRLPSWAGFQDQHEHLPSLWLKNFKGIIWSIDFLFPYSKFSRAHWDVSLWKTILYPAAVLPQQMGYVALHILGCFSLFETKDFGPSIYYLYSRLQMVSAHLFFGGFFFPWPLSGKRPWKENINSLDPLNWTKPLAIEEKQCYTSYQDSGLQYFL